ncbi:MAG: hypothetical protein GY861_17045 [bacterium]|nr:hypothetical protein [bacterium]
MKEIKDKIVLQALKKPENWKPDLSKIAEIVDMPISTTFDRINRVRPKLELKIKPKGEHLTQQKVLKILNGLQQTIGKSGTNIVCYELIEEKKKELGL